jgi:hypothetical protein
MPIYLLMTIAVAARSRGWRSVTLAVATFVVCLLPMAAWYVTHPERNAQIVSAYQLTGSSGGSWVGAAAAAIGKYLSLYWLFFDPAYFFVSGDASMVNSTRTAGLFPIAFAILLPIGLIALIRRAQPIGWVLVAGFLAAPLVSVISGAIEMNRVMFAIPFAVLIAAYGVQALADTRSPIPRLLAGALVLSIGWQFSVFHRSYMGTAYRLSAAPWFSGNVREALRELIARSGDGDVYVSREIDWVHRMWRFYAIEAGRLDLMARTTYFSEPPTTAAPGSTLICPAGTVMCTALADSGAWRKVITVPSIGGTHSYVILESVGIDRATNNKRD